MSMPKHLSKFNFANKMLKDRSTPIQSSNDKWFPQKKKDFALENKLYGFNCEGKNDNFTKWWVYTRWIYDFF